MSFPDGLVRRVEFEPLHPMVTIFYRDHRVLREVGADENINAEALFGKRGPWAEIILDAIDTRNLLAASVATGNRTVELLG